MNKPPGHYRDERGREYYWDGERRSYIPDNTLRDLMDNLNKVAIQTGVFLVFLIVGIPIIVLLGYILYSLGNALGPVSEIIGVFLLIYLVWRVRKSRRNR